MNLVEFIQNLAIEGWELSSDGNQLHYKAPVEQSVSPILSQLKQYKVEIIQLLCDQPNIVNVQPLSHGQKALWFLWQLDPLSAAYNLVVSSCICDDVNLTSLYLAFEKLIKRHSSLGSTFPTIRGEPIQQLHQGKVLNFQQVDASNWNKAEIYPNIYNESRRPFDLEKESVARLRLFTCSEREHILLITIHHIATDGWSSDIILSELSQLYQSQQKGIIASLPTLQHSYSDYVRFQKKLLEGSYGERLWSYWQDQLKGELPVLNLPTDKPRPPIQTFNGASYKFRLPSQLVQKIKQLAALSDATFYMVTLAAFYIFLHRYTGQEHILVGSPVACRLQPQFRGIVGYFSNLVALRGDLSNNPSFEEFLKQVCQTVLGALTHQDYPFAMLVEKLQPQRDLSGSPFFQTSFTLQQLTQSQESFLVLEAEKEVDIDWGGMKLKPFNIPQQEGQVDLDLEIVECSSAVFGIFKYNTDLFKNSTVERMADHFQNLLLAIVENPQQLVGKLTLLSKSERHQLLVEWNDTLTNDSFNQCFPQLFEAQVLLTPNATAVVFKDKQLTYQQLNVRANRWANYLVTRGVESETLIALLSERNIDFLTAMLAIFKAGGVYVPLNPEHPAERIQQVLERSKASIVIDFSSFTTPIDSSIQIVLLEHIDQADLSSENLPVHCTPDRLAYVIYTSGSTGIPKGAMIEHKGMLNHLYAKRIDLQLTSNDVIAQTATQTFDISIWQFLVALLVGGRVEIISQEVVVDPIQLLLLVNRRQISILEIVPSLLGVILNLTSQKSSQIGDGMQNSNLRNEERLDSLRWLILTGEALPPQLCREWFNIYPTVSIMNAYGPTECSDDVTHYSLIQPPTTEILNIPIGRPVANTQLYILDSLLQPLPIGVTGELYVGGVGVGRGYINNFQLTRLNFIPNPFSNDKSARLYKTGDLARYRTDGNIEFLGRIDNQVKIRGFRIELGEVEAILSTHPQVQQAVVIATDFSINKRLVAYVVTKNESLITNNQLREFLNQKLPTYMVPAAFIFLEALPLTPNGKVDFKALPTSNSEVTSVHEYVAPRTIIEQRLTSIWQELLIQDKVSIHDNFFEIGGDSILSIQVVSRAKAAGIQVTPQQVFQNQTIAELARVVNTTVSVSAQQGMVIGLAPLTPSQHWFFSQNQQEIHHFNQSVLLEIPNHLQNDLIETAFKKLLEHHDALRLRFVVEGSQWKQINQGFDDNILFSVVDLSSTHKLLQSQDLSKIATEFQASLNLSTGPIIKVVRFNLETEGNARLLVIIHHLVVDGMSWRILLSDLGTIYQQLINQKPIQLSAKTTSFIEWAEKLSNYAQSEFIKKELGYWIDQDWSKTTSLPLDTTCKQLENTFGSTSAVSVKLNREETRILLGAVNEAYNTQINDILLSALTLSLTQWTGNSTVLIALEGHGREELFEDVDLSRTVGWFTSFYPVLLQLPSSGQLSSVIKLIKEQLRAIPNHGIGYGILQYLSKDTNIYQQLQVIPTPEIIFNYLGQFDQIQSEIGWKFATESTGANQRSKRSRHHLLDVNCLVVEGKLQIVWTYSSNFHTHVTIEKLSQIYVQSLKSLIEHCQSEDNFGYTPSDFPLLQLNQEKLNALLEYID
jgi:amino acid adenylation domain-containing protein/non-ribosomal peptide synthase protein (TIGR01720 family)